MYHRLNSVFLKRESPGWGKNAAQQVTRAAIPIKVRRDTRRMTAPWPSFPWFPICTLRILERVGQVISVEIMSGYFSLLQAYTAQKEFLDQNELIPFLKNAALFYY